MVTAMFLPAWSIPMEGGLRVTEEATEAALARASAAGDRSAFARLVERTKRPVYGLCLRLLGDSEEARDAAQESFVRAWTALSTFDSTHPFAPWVLRIARNHCIDVVRRRIPASRKVELDAVGEDDRKVELPDPEAAPADQSLERAQLRSTLDQAVQRLPERYREVIHLFHVEQLSYKEIATTLDVPMGTVMTWLHRARAQLREQLTLAGEERA
jgi:RNA polymerase sigma-70 factor (ECF subfamily)